MTKRYLVALLTNDLVGSYQYALWGGMKAAAREEDCDLISFNGGELSSSDPSKSMRMSVFDLVKYAKPDAIVLTAPVLANATTPEERAAFIASFAPTPVVTVGVVIPGHPAVMVDNAHGMEGAVEHLVAAHGRRRLVYMGGPILNPDAIVRREAFLAVLERHGIAFDPSYDIVGEFDFGIARDRLLELLDTGAAFDGVVAANDEMALAAMEALKERGRKIPDDVVVIGFDDIEDGQYANPALATVRQPVFEQGEASLRIALDLLDGIEVKPETRHAAVLVRRGSCGCHSYALEDACRERSVSTSGAPGGPEHLEECKKACCGLDGGVRLGESLDELVKAMVEDVHGYGRNGTLKAFYFLLETHSRPDDSPERWQVFLSRIRHASLPFFSGSSAISESFEGLLHQMRVIVHERAVQLAAYRSVQTQRWTRKLNETGCQLVNSFDVADLVETLFQDMKNLQITSIHLLLREKALDPVGGRLVLSVDQGVRAELPPGGRKTRYDQLFDRLVRKALLRSTLVVEPLFFGKTQIGYVFLELALRRGVLLDILRAQISAALMGARITHGSVHR